MPSQGGTNENRPSNHRHESVRGDRIEAMSGASARSADPFPSGVTSRITEPDRPFLAQFSGSEPLPEPPRAVVAVGLLHLIEEHVRKFNIQQTWKGFCTHFIESKSNSVRKVDAIRGRSPAASAAQNLDVRPARGADEGPRPVSG